MKKKCLEQLKLAKNKQKNNEQENLPLEEKNYQERFLKNNKSFCKIKKKCLKQLKKRRLENRKR